MNINRFRIEYLFAFLFIALPFFAITSKFLNWQQAYEHISITLIISVAVFSIIIVVVQISSKEIPNKEDRIKKINATIDLFMNDPLNILEFINKKKEDIQVKHSENKILLINSSKSREVSRMELVQELRYSKNTTIRKS